MTGERGPGTRLITVEVAERWGVSRGAICEVFLALENEGIVVSTRRRGSVVGTMSIEDLEEALSVREAIETFSAIGVCNLVEVVTQTRLFALVDAGWCDCAGAVVAGVSRSAGGCGLCAARAGRSAAAGVAAVCAARFGEQGDGGGNAGLGA